MRKNKNIVDFFNNIYALIKNKNAWLTSLKFYSLERFIIRNIANFLIPIYFKATSSNVKNCIHSNNVKKKRLIVSLTSFPARINRVWLVIETLMRQSHKPDMIILWLSTCQFPSKKYLPESLLRLEKRGLRIELVKNDLRSHKKYFYVFQNFPEDIIVTVDDDIFYPSTAIEELMNYHQIFPEAIIARYGSKIEILNNEIISYKMWRNHYEQVQPDYNVFFGSGGGALFPPNSLPKVTFEKGLFIELCFYADDIWLNTMCRLNGKKIFKTKSGPCSLLPVLNKNNVTLSGINLHKDLNDEQLKNVRNHFIMHEGVDPYVFHSPGNFTSVRADPNKNST